jgi:hypothetical protein
LEGNINLTGVNLTATDGDINLTANNNTNIKAVFEFGLKVLELCLLLG